MIYTSYFGQLKNLPCNIIPISICAKQPDWYKGLQYKKLAPKYKFFMEWKQNHDNDFYIKHFNEEVLSQLNYQTVLKELQILAGFGEYQCIQNDLNWHIALICYEKPFDFCHRHLVADWLSKNGIKCTEWARGESKI